MYMYIKRTLKTRVKKVKTLSKATSKPGTQILETHQPVVVQALYVPMQRVYLLLAQHRTFSWFVVDTWFA